MRINSYAINVVTASITPPKIIPTNGTKQLIKFKDKDKDKDKDKGLTDIREKCEIFKTR